MANEKRLIDLDVAIAKIQDEGVLGEGYAAYERIEDVCDMLEDCPTVDAVEVVRCANCRSLNMTGYDEDNAQITDPTLQSGFCEMWGKDTQLCNFCSYGERREGE